MAVVLSLSPVQTALFRPEMKENLNLGWLWVSLVDSDGPRDDLFPFHVESFVAVFILLGSYVPALENEGRTEDGPPISLESHSLSSTPGSITYQGRRRRDLGQVQYLASMSSNLCVKDRGCQWPIYHRA